MFNLALPLRHPNWIIWAFTHIHHFNWIYSCTIYSYHFCFILYTMYEKMLNDVYWYIEYRKFIPHSDNHLKLKKWHNSSECSLNFHRLNYGKSTLLTWFLKFHPKTLQTTSSKTLHKESKQQCAALVKLTTIKRVRHSQRNTSRHFTSPFSLKPFKYRIRMTVLKMDDMVHCDSGRNQLHYLRIFHTLRSFACSPLMK